MALLCAPCQLQHGAAEAPLPRLPGNTHTWSLQGAMHIFRPCTCELRSLQGKGRKAPNSVFKSFHLIPELLWGVRNGGPWVLSPTHPLVSAFHWGWGEEKLTKEELERRDRKKEDGSTPVPLSFISLLLSPDVLEHLTLVTCG